MASRLQAPCWRSSIRFVDDEDEELASQVRQLGEPAIKALHRYLTAPREAQTDVSGRMFRSASHDAAVTRQSWIRRGRTFAFSHI